ncbi:MAG TPA: QueT transporter family protein [Thermodesulfobacteriota bacterium]|nr:QueT transporter family protein [Thermodesulfobacteriota bacterium]
MKAALRMWKNTRMIILVAVCAAIYGAALIAFKTAIPLIPGITEVRVANIFPMAFGMLFGPAGAWGTAIGNLIGDLFGGTLGPTSIAGFVGNFLLGYLPYTMWTTFLPFTERSQEWSSDRWQSWASYILIAFISSAACAVVIGVAADALGIIPYTILTKIITFNDTVASWIGILLFISVYGVTKQQLGLFWADVMEENERGSPIAGTMGAWLVTAASIFGLVGGIITGLPATTIGWVCALAIITGCLLL